MKSIKMPLLAATSAMMLATALASSANAIPYRDDVGNEGAREFAQGWDGVVQIYLWNRVSGSIDFNCTGSLINARTVLTAAHCFDAFPEEVYADAPGSLTPIIAFGEDTLAPLFNWAQVDRQFVDDLNGLTFGVDLMMHPDGEVNGDADFPAADVAMIALANPLYTLPTYGMLFSPIPEDVFNEGVLVNQIGYGGFHPGSDSSFSDIDGRRRAGENMLGLMASQNDFFQALAGGGSGSSAAGDNQLLYWTDFDLPGRTGTCVRANLGATAEDSILCDDNTPGDGVRLDGDTVILPGPSIDYFPGEALPNEAATAGGDSGGPLMAMNLFNNPLILGVLSGGFVDGFFHSSGQSYGEVSYYNPLFTSYQWISENNPYKYVSALAGDGMWSDPDHWIQGLDPNYFIYNEDGEIVNALPEGEEGGPDQRRPIVGTVFDTPVASTDPGDDPTGAGGPLEDLTIDQLVMTLPEDLRAAFAGYDWSQGGAANPQTVSGLVQILTGPGYTGFVPDNYYGGVNAPAFQAPAQFFDVTLAAAGTTTLARHSVEIDNLTLAGGDARLVIAEDGFLASLIGVNLIAGELEVNGGLFSRELMVWAGLLSGSGSISLFDPNAFLGNGDVLDGAVYNVGGVVTAGAVGETGLLTINGDYIQTAGGVLGVDWSADDADRLAVNGDISLDGVIAVNPLGGYVPAYGDTRRILDFTGERVGAFAGDNLPGVLYLATSYGVDFVSVSVQAASYFTEASFQNPAQAGLAQYLDGARSASYDALEPLYRGLDLQSGEALSTSFEALVPHEAYQARRASRAHLEAFSHQMRDIALTQGQSDGSTRGAAAFTARLMDADMRPTLNEASLALQAEDTASGPAMTQAGHGVRIFAAGGRLDGDVQTTNVSQADLEGQYGLVGADIQTRDWLRLGGVLGYAASDAETRVAAAGFTSAGVKTLQLSAYALAERGPLIGMARISAASHDVDSQRSLTVGGQSLAATGSQDADTLEASLMGAYRFAAPERRLAITPLVSLTWSETEYDAGQQSGSAAAINLAESIETELVARAGVELSTGFDWGQARLQPRAYLGFAGDLREGSDVVYGAFSTAPGLFSIAPGVNGNEEWTEIRLGVTTALPNNLTVALSYDQVTDCKDVLSTEALSVGARLRF